MGCMPQLSTNQEKLQIIKITILLHITTNPLWKLGMLYILPLVEKAYTWES